MQAFATPEIATVLFLQGCMSNGSYADFVAEEGWSSIASHGLNSWP